ncbi:hypothetical protein F3Y22_tig00117034pilonHSYRG00824 [Hibiscus syriacus]|uniref:Uncharacterized protein n=1 Tax=Hibiscus syriacus TaxID=106335 RepID=A0A6A2XMK0_HIBSY|nr:hypothetical protein F3Y22_tig00117034pilonHSYRG00824 [Hibiscus syriacus]
MPKKNQNMAEDLAGLQKQMEELTTLVKQGQDESNPPKWWENQDNRISALESRMATNHGYVEEILKILTGRKEDQDQSIEDQDEHGILKSKPNDLPVHLASFKNDNKIGENSAARNQLMALEVDKRGHQCKVKQLNMMIEDDTVIPSDNLPTDLEQQNLQEEENLEISMNAITGCIVHNTLRIQGTIQGRPLNILIDNGSTHSFLTPQWDDAGATLLKMTASDYAILGHVVLLSMFEDSKTIPEALQPLLNKYQYVFAEPTDLPPTRNHDHAIPLKPEFALINLRSYRFPHNQKEEVEKQIATMLSSSIIHPSKSPFSSPCLLIKKKDRTWRFCVDYRKLNSKIVKDKFPIPVVEDLLDELHGAVYFSKIDLRSGYWQIRIKAEDIYKITFRTHQGHYEFKVDYLGHIISAAGVSTDPTKVESMRNWPIPKSLKSLHGFLGLTGYYRRFIKDYGTISKPLTQMLKKYSFTWSSEALHAFEDLKQAMCTAPVLALPDFGKQFYLETDGSSGGIGAVLTQEVRPIAYLSKGLSPRHAALSIYEREYLAILLAVSKWRHYLEITPFIIKTDHESLKYLKGKSNIVADALSRQWEDQAHCFAMGTTLIIPSWVQQVEESYKEDSVATEWISVLTVNPNADSRWKYSRGILRYKDRVYIGVAGALRLQILQTLHDSPRGGHSGIQATYQRIIACFYWTKLKSMVAAYIRSCSVCQQTKVEHVPKPGLLQPLLIPHREDIRRLFKEQLEIASNGMKQKADKHRSERVFEVGDSVYLKLQPYRQTTLALRKNLKLAAKFYGPYKIIERIEEVVYRLSLPKTSRLHHVFHVSLLKKHIGDSVVSSMDPPAINTDDQFRIEPYTVLGRRIINRQNRPVTQLLVRWMNLDERHMIRGRIILFFEASFQASILGDKDHLQRRVLSRSGEKREEKNEAREMKSRLFSLVTVKIGGRRMSLMELEKRNYWIPVFITVSLHCHEEKLAFWINIHNSLVMHAFLAYGIPQNKVETFSTVEGHTISADTIQSSILGCRMSRPGEVRAYTPKRVLQELETAKEEYIRATFRARNKKILLPKIVESFAKNSSLCRSGLMEMIQQSLPESLRCSIRKCQQGKSRKSIEWIPHNFTFRYLISKELER